MNGSRSAQVDAGERAADREALALEARRRGGHRAAPGAAAVAGSGLGDAGQDGEVVDGDGGHAAPPWLKAQLLVTVALGVRDVFPFWRSRPDRPPVVPNPCKEVFALLACSSAMPDPAPLEPAVQVTDGRALRALAHPAAGRMLGRLRLDGPATASRLGRVVGDNSGQTATTCASSPRTASSRTSRAATPASAGGGPAPDDQLAGRRRSSRRRAAPEVGRRDDPACRSSSTAGC